MTARVTLIAPAVNAALREARFDDGEPLEAAGRTRAEELGRALDPVRTSGGAGARVLVSPSVRCRETAEALGFPGAAPVDALAGCAMGRWRGRTLDALVGEEEESVAAWLSDPDAAPHGGESLRALRERVGGWLDAPHPAGRVLVVAEPDVVRAVVVHALGADDRVFWRLDVRPLAGVHLSGRSGRWNLRLGGPFTGAGGDTD
ncbi:histidine phosphatase family protein [Streptomyces sp. ms191]|uniref:histidine phosphatase family protein n=1 Tax=unclassified Streptomyces TaxID=2593676 RepID=UPI0011CE9FD7|nr:histidine phosphatase family protein [Streptomyces sp. ms191]TXS21626.1 histidine phosphatase family protein [Streptomyces sp. ms191]